MRTTTIALAFGLVTLGSAQSISHVYNRDSGQPFKLKDVQVDQTVVGPLVRTSTVLTFDNPYKNLTEASVNFDMFTEAALGGFGYYYGDEYVKGQLMDKAKAWAIYTAITSRNRDPGIMDQVTPSSYHCQIYPLKVGSDLKVKLYTLGFVHPQDQGISLPKPSWEGYEPKVTYRVRQPGKPSVETSPSELLPTSTRPVQAVAQRFKDGRTYVAGIVRVKPNRTSSPAAPTFARLREAKFVPIDDQTIAFMGWVPRNRKIAVRPLGERFAFRPQLIYRGGETAKLWAQQKLAQGSWYRSRDVLKFSMKYGIPSTQTALLAVPKSEMALFRQKEKEFEKAERDRVRNERKFRGTNWNSSGGGDPEIRVSFPGATRAYAVLPDGRVITLRQMSPGVWGGNFDIPANAAEGKYVVRVVGVDTQGNRQEQSLPYDVDRTAPEGKATFRVENGQLVLEVRSEDGLGDVIAYRPDGSQIILERKEPGLYRAELPIADINLTIVLKDRASNKRELTCSWSR